MKTYVNYHKHSYYSNAFVQDSTVSVEQYLERIAELGHKAYSTVEHGYMGMFYNHYLEVEKFNKKRIDRGLEPIKIIAGCEAYWVQNRFEKDKANGHIVLLARNNNGRKAINRITSQANKDGYYYKPRVDLELLMSLPPNDVMITTACIAFNRYEDIDDIILMLNDRFPHFYLEVQAHNVETQKKWNQHLLNLSYEYDLKIIAGCDSHMIDKSQEIERDNYLKSYKISYEEESGWDLTYPDYDTLFKNFQRQGVLSDEEISIAIDNTNKILDFENIVLDKNLKLPNVYPDLSQEERNIKLKNLVYENWEKEKINIPQKEWKHYKEQIEYELSEIIGCHMSDYFLLNEKIVGLGIKKYGGILTHSSRGSAGGCYIGKLLGFTNIDRINAPVPLIFERFLTKDRILKSKSLVDIDWNVADRQPFIMAQKELLGEKSSYDLLAFGTLKTKAAFKLYCRACDVNPEEANEVSKQIEKYEEKLKYAERDDTGELLEEINIEDFVEPKYSYLIEESKKYLGIKTNARPHPCGFCTTSINLEEEIGIIKVKSEATRNEVLCVCIESGDMDAFQFVKEDFLKVEVVKTTNEIYKRIGISQPSVSELLNIVKNNNKVWDIYAKGLTLGVNQVEQEGSRNKCKKYKPKNIVELTAFVAAIRPSFKSLVKQFISRKPFEYGIKELDELLQTKEMPYSYIFYQEQLMKILEFAGFPMKETYDIIKMISKKKTYCANCGTIGNDGMTICPSCKGRVIKPLVDKYKEQFVEGFIKRTGEGNSDMALKVYQIVVDFAKYGFNCSHSYAMALDSVEQAYLKAYYPGEFYEVMLRTYTEKGEKDKVSAFKQEMKNFGIKLGKIAFGENNYEFKYIPEKNEITQNITSFKNINQQCAIELYKLSQAKHYNNFLELLKDIKEETSISKRQLDPLIDMGYFEEFGNTQYIRKCYEVFEMFYKKVQFSNTNPYSYIIEKYANKKTPKQYREVDTDKVMLDIMSNYDKAVSDIEKVIYDFKKYNETSHITENKYYVVMDLDTKYSPKLTLYNTKNKNKQVVKISKALFNKIPLSEYDAIKIKKVVPKPRTKKIDGEWTNLSVTDYWIIDYEKV
jgi:DNA polymerase III alpha subunit